MKLVMTTLVALGVAVSSHAQSLGEIAKKTQEERDKAKTTAPAKVYTNTDLRDSSPPLATTPAATTASTTSTDTTKVTTPKTDTADKSKELAKDEAYWRGRMSSLRSRLATDDAACAPKRTLVTRLSNMLSSLPDTAPAIVAGGIIAASGSIAADLAKARTDMEQCEAAVKTDKQVIADTEEEARRLGVLPGWLR
jgi:hypothetical protein